jgi:hypothetical protein
MRQTKALTDLHADLLADFERTEAAQRDERLQALEDRRFYSIAGAMWEGALGEKFENKPKIEVNKIHLAVIRLINEYRNNRITVDFISKDGTDNQELAETCDMLYRADEQDSVAEEAYDNAFEEAVGGGFGAFRFTTEYEDESDEENEKQCIRIKPIFDADSCVYFNLNAKRQDKSDARRCWVLIGMTHEAYKEEWGIDPAGIQRTVESAEFDWCTPDTVYVAEVYEVEDVGEEIQWWSNPTVDEPRKIREMEFEADPELRETLKATGWKKDRSRKIKRKRVHKYIMDGARILEDCGLIAGCHIPVVPVYGKRWFVDGIERFMGHVRLAKDAQRLKNMQLSKLAELAAISSTEKPMLFPEQVTGHEAWWADDHIKNRPFLLINPIRNDAGEIVTAGPIGMTKPPAISPAMGALLQITDMDIADILGNQQMGEKMEANQSGKAVELIQTRLDMQAFIYMSNMAKAVKRGGEIWLSMAKDVFVEKGRKLKGVTKQYATESVELMQMKMKDGQAYEANDLSRAEFDVTVDVGPSSDSKRAATVKALTNIAMITEDPETKQILLACAMQNMEGEGLGELREFYRRKMVAMGVYEPTEEDKTRMQEESANQQPDPNREFLAAEAKKSLSMAQKAGSETILNMEKAAKTKVETITALAQLDPAMAAEEIVGLREGAQPQMPEQPPEMMQDMPMEGMPQEIAPAAQ